jgi:hypothetical protein
LQLWLLQNYIFGWIKEQYANSTNLLTFNKITTRIKK